MILKRLLIVATPYLAKCSTLHVASMLQAVCAKMWRVTQMVCAARIEADLNT